MSNKNMFALLNDSDSDDEPKPAAAKAPAPSAPKPERKPERKPRAQVREDRPARPEREAPYEGGDKVVNPASDRERQGKGDRKGGKGERRGEKGKGASRGDSGREMPRRSGTGRGRENPRSGGGKYNWGKDSEAPAPDSADAQPAEAAAPAEAAEPVVEEEEEPTMSLEEYEAQQAEKLSALNLNKQAERTVEKPDDVTARENDAPIEDEYACMFHDYNGKKKEHAKKKGKHGSKQADQVLNLKFVDESADTGKGKGGKGERRKGSGEKGARTSGKGGAGANPSSTKAAIDLSNDMAFPTLGA